MSGQVAAALTVAVPAAVGSNNTLQDQLALLQHQHGDLATLFLPSSSSHFESASGTSDALLPTPFTQPRVAVQQQQSPHEHQQPQQAQSLPPQPPPIQHPSTLESDAFAQQLSAFAAQFGGGGGGSGAAAIAHAPQFPPTSASAAHMASSTGPTLEQALALVHQQQQQTQGQPQQFQFPMLSPQQQQQLQQQQQQQQQQQLPPPDAIQAELNALRAQLAIMNLQQQQQQQQGNAQQQYSQQRSPHQPRRQQQQQQQPHHHHQQPGFWPPSPFGRF
jgi:hypothetical protein